VLTPSSRRRLCRHHRHLLCRRRRLRLPLPLRLLPRLALVEGGHRQLPTDQEGLSRRILDAFCSCPMVRLVALGKRRHSQCPGGRNYSNVYALPQPRHPRSMLFKNAPRDYCCVTSPRIIHEAWTAAPFPCWRFRWAESLSGLRWTALDDVPAPLSRPRVPRMESVRADYRSGTPPFAPSQDMQGRLPRASGLQ
jgi:hypothetical protein